MSYTVSPQIQAVFDKLLADEKIQKALAYLEADHDNKIAELKEMAQVPGTPFTEHLHRAPMYKAKLEKYGLKNCVIDSEANAYGYLEGTAARPKVLMEGHLDTVFAEDTPLVITEKDGRIYCPGIADDTAALAANLSVLRAIMHAGPKPVGKVMIGGTSGEEGEGNIRGIRTLLREHTDIDACLNVEAAFNARITYGAIGSTRYEFIFRGPGGHSWSAYGLPSPLHALGRAIAKMSDVVTPEDPKTTYTVGVISGGTSINSIANEGRLKLDIRSVCAKTLKETACKMLALVDMAVAEENLFRAKSGQVVTVEAVHLGDRPAGTQALDSMIVQTAYAATTAVGVEPNITPPSSTNANAPISMGVPAVVIGAGGKTGNTHALDEWYEPAEAYKGAQKALLMLFALAGLDGVTEPLAKPVTRK